MSYKVQKPCNVCGRLYTPCGDCERDNTAFHWRTVACSYKCGQEYLRRVMEARSKDEKIEQKKRKQVFSIKLRKKKHQKKRSCEQILIKIKKKVSRLDRGWDTLGYSVID